MGQVLDFEMIDMIEKRERMTFLRKLFRMNPIKEKRVHVVVWDTNSGMIMSQNYTWVKYG